MKSRTWIKLACLVVLTQISAVSTPKIFPAARVAEIYRILLDRDDLLLESIEKAIQQNTIQDGALLTGIGSLSECTYHWVKSTATIPQNEFTTVKDAMEILNLNGIIANGEPHLHITLSTPKGAFGGHLEKGCRVLYLAELTIAKYNGAALIRKNNPVGVSLLQTK
jgi:predicted DNA-binding protein with PD1-like motif